jgi:anti-sigma regulatory factor (Ser/Thr protein kinase)
MTARSGADTDDQLWLAVDDAGSVGAARRAAASVAADVGLAAERAADLAIVATELASNLYRHAVDGSLLVRPARRPAGVGVQLVATDRGPGMTDLGTSTRDGHSTAGTLGIGLGAVVRQANEYDAYSLPGAGTVIAATVLPAGVDNPGGAGAADGISRPMAGESLCGDAHAVRTIGNQVQLLVCDGLGHGPLAAFAAQAAVAAFHTAPDGGPGAVVAHLHQALRHTRGAVATVVALDEGGASVRFAGLGNVFGAVVDGAERRILATQPGIVGDRLPQVRELELPLPDSAILVLHSDGLRDRWRLDDYPGLVARTPLVIAATLLRDCGVRRDDATILVARAAR